MRNKSAVPALRFVMLVLKNVRSISRWNTVNCVLKHVEVVLKNVVKWLGSQPNVNNDRPVGFNASFHLVVIPKK
jgi:hypothetical protein